jgi:hypothetical protein
MRGRGGSWYVEVTDTQTGRSLKSTTGTALRQDNENLKLAYHLLEKLINQGDN